MKLSESELEAQYPEMPSIASDIEISQNASMKQIPEIASMLDIDPVSYTHLTLPTILLV